MRNKLFILVFFTGSLLAQNPQVSVTVYNVNRALVHDVRPMRLEKGLQRISIQEVAEQIDPTSVHIISISNPDKLNILEQNYEYDLVSASKILTKYVDHDIRIVMTGGEIFEGMLLASDNQNIVLSSKDDQIQVIKASGIQHFDFPKLPEGLITRPTLVWDVNNSGPEKQNLQLSYLTRGMNWHAEYVAVVDDQDKILDLSGWVSVQNNSGTSFPNARLRLVAGDVHTVTPQDQRLVRKDVMMAPARAVQEFEEEELFEYHLYTLQRPSTLNNNQTKQIALFSPARTSVNKQFFYDSRLDASKIRVNLTFINSEKHGLGMPLPKGVLRVYKKSADQTLTFIGEDRIDHTPRNKEVTVFMGNAFDLSAERKQLSRKQISERVQELSYEVTLRNHKKEDVIIVVRESAWGDWTIKDNTHPVKNEEARQFEFHIPVKADDQAIVRYTLTIRY